MIRIKTTKNKFIAAINGIIRMTESIRNSKKNLKDWPLVTANAHLDVLEDLSRKLRRKMITIETKQGQHSFTFSINGIEGLIFMTNKNNFHPDPFTMSVIEEYSNIIFMKLIS